MADDQSYYERLQVLVSQESSSSYRTVDYLLLSSDADVAATATATARSNNSPGSNYKSSPTGNKKRRLTETTIIQSPVENNDPPSSSSNVSSEGTSRKYWRETMCSWAYKVIDHFDLNRQIVVIAMNYLDRYIATLNDPLNISKHRYQLAAMTCIYLAIKLFEFKHIGIPGSPSTMDTILQLSKGEFTLRQMERMEYDVLQRLQWHVHPPTPQDFIALFLDGFSQSSTEQQQAGDLSEFMVELSVMDYFFISYRPSEIAAAALLNSIEQLYGAFLPMTMSKAVERIHNFDPYRIQQCRTRLEAVLRQMGDVEETQPQRSSPSEGNKSPVTVTTTMF